MTCNKYSQCTGKCIMESWLCDGEVDCAQDGQDSSDEDPELCSNNSTCPAGHTACRDMSCISTLHHCDNIIQCLDNSDEGPFCDLLDCANSNCSYGCRMTWQGPRCICPAGKHPAGSICLDANECTVEGTCDQLCTDVPGSYKCGCVPGYQFEPPSSCIAINEPFDQPPSLLVSTTDTLQNMDMDGTVFNKLSALDAYAVDFNHRNQSFCWISHSYTATVSPKVTSAAQMHCSNIQMTEGKHSFNCKTFGLKLLLSQRTWNRICKIQGFCFGYVDFFLQKNPDSLIFS